MRSIYTILAFMCWLTLSARDFTYNGITYTVLDEKVRTVETKAGSVEIDSDEKENHVAGNNAIGALNLPETVTDGEKEYLLVRIGDNGFAYNKISNVTIPESVTEIGSYAFYGYGTLSTINFQDLLSTIGESAFFGCFPLQKVVLPNELRKIESNAFAGCASLEEVVFLEKLYYISKGAFFMCSSLTDISLPDGVLGIDEISFWGCTGLKTIKLPTKLIALGNQSFDLCTGIETIYYNTTSPALTVKGAFSSESYSRATLYEPFDATDKFESTQPWKLFQKIQGYDFSSRVNIVGEDVPVEYYDLNGMRVETPQRGQILIKKQGGTTQKIVF